MRTIIMAAGVGTRISRHINNVPKCTLDIGNISIIENTILLLNKIGIKDIGIVLGYKSDYVIEILKEYDVKVFINPFYKITNSISSLWFARDFINVKDDLILLNGDVYFEDDLLKQVIAEELSPVLFADKSRALFGDYKFKYADNVLQKFGKELSDEDSTGEYIGIAKINMDFIPIFIKNMDYLIKNEKFNLWWEDTLYSLVGKREIYVKDIEEKFWGEVDYYEDYIRILDIRKKLNYWKKNYRV